jgi:outer membrane protein OmpA-like peptidoglycan-associated protein
MKNIKNYKEFIDNSVNEEEGWKDIALGTALAAGSLIPGQLKAGETGYSNTDKQSTEISYEAPAEKDSKSIDWPWSKKTKTIHKKVKTQDEVDKLVNRGWSLDSSQVDTLWKEVTIQKPDTTVHIDEIKFDNNQYFASGKYNLNEDMGDSISSTIDDILAQGGIISGIQVESSTDKQGLSLRLQNELKSIGYSGDNTGLSKARCEQITDYLVGLGIDSSLVTSNQVVEGGTGTVDASARYVIVKIVYLDKEVVATPGIVEKVPQLKEIHYLSKEVKVTKHKKTHHKKHHVKHKRTHIKKCSNITKCFEF